MTKDELITEIRTAFKNIKLEEGVGLWEGQGIDDYADSETILKLRKRDERNNWNTTWFSWRIQHINYWSSHVSW